MKIYLCKPFLNGRPAKGGPVQVIARDDETAEIVAARARVMYDRAFSPLPPSAVFTLKQKGI